MFRSVFEGFETFLFVSGDTSKSGVHIHDSVDAKRTMTAVIIALIPAMLFGMYNTGYQHYLAIGLSPGPWLTFVYGLLAVLPIIVVSYVVGLGIEFAVAQWKKEEIQEGFLVSGILIPLIVPVNTPLWMIAVATAFAVIFAKEVFGGTGYNIFNVALVTRAFLFFAYPASMSGDKVFVRTTNSVFDFLLRFDKNNGFTEVVGTGGLDGGHIVDGFSGATPLAQINIAPNEAIGSFQAVDVLGHPLSLWDMFVGLIPGSIGETSTLAILIGAVILLFTGVASWKTMASVFVGGAFMAAIFNLIGTTVFMTTSPLEHLILGGFAFGAVFMATDPVTSARTEKGKYIFGFLVGAMAILIRVLNPGFPEGMMLSILLMNIFAPLIDYYVVESNISKRLKRAINK
jgi:Na+-transporting NADH:ubiquinone oxidoreductase subunit B